MKPTDAEDAARAEAHRGAAERAADERCRTRRRRSRATPFAARNADRRDAAGRARPTSSLVATSRRVIFGLSRRTTRASVLHRRATSTRSRKRTARSAVCRARIACRSRRPAGTRAAAPGPAGVDELGDQVRQRRRDRAMARTSSTCGYPLNETIFLRMKDAERHHHEADDDHLVARGRVEERRHVLRVDAASARRRGRTAAPTSTYADMRPIAVSALDLARELLPVADGVGDHVEQARRASRRPGAGSSTAVTTNERFFEPTRSAMSSSASSIGRPSRVSVSTRLNSFRGRLDALVDDRLDAPAGSCGPPSARRRRDQEVGQLVLERRQPALRLERHEHERERAAEREQPSRRAKPTRRRRRASSPSRTPTPTRCRRAQPSSAAGRRARAAG